MIPVKNVFAQYRVIKGIAYLTLNYALYELDEVGQLIWKCLDGVNDIDGISQEVSKEYNVDIGVVKNDVQDFVKELIDAGLVQI